MNPLTPEQVRAEYPVLQTTTFLDCAYKGPFPTRSARAMRDYIEARHHRILPDGRRNGRDERIQDTRVKVAPLLGVSPDDVWFPRSTNDALCIVANMLLKPGDEILVGGLDHPSNYGMWAHLAGRGIEVTVVPHRGGHVEVGDLEAAVGPRTRAIGMCLVNTYNGYRQDLEELDDLAGRRNLYLLVDAIQGTGHLNLDLGRTPNVTVLSAGVFKWLCSPEGTGIAYLNREVLADAVPDTAYYSGMESTVEGGWGGLIDRMFRFGYENAGPQPLSSDIIRYRDDARRMDLSLTSLSLTGLGAMASLVRDFGGIAAVEQRVLGLAARLRSSLQEHGHTVLSDPDPRYASGITSVEVEDAAAFAQFCEERNIWVLARPSKEGSQAVRVSTHFFNNEDDIAVFTEAMDEFRARRS